MNKNNLYLSTLTVALVLLFASATFPVTTVQADPGYVEVSDGLEVGGRLDTSKVYWRYDASYLYLKVEYGGEKTSSTAWMGYFYIDSDMNPSTGWSSRGIGADYGVSYFWNTDGGKYCDLYSLPGNGHIKNLSVSTDSTWVEVTVPLADVGSPTLGVRFYFKAQNYIVDPIDTTATYNKGTPVTITVDGNPSDWAGISPIITDPSGDVAVTTFEEYDITAIYMASDNSKLYLRYDTLAPPNTTLLPTSSNSNVDELLLIYFDTDQNAATGSPQDGIGAEYYAWFQSSKSEWGIFGIVPAYQWGSWTLIDVTEESAVSTIREWSVLLSDFGLDIVSSFDILAKYAEPVHYDFIPDSGSVDALISAGPQAFSAIGSYVLEAAADEAYFIYADPHRMERAVATYDVAAGSIAHAICMNEQKENFDNHTAWVSQDPADKGRLLLEDKPALMFGSHWPHWSVKYLQDQGLLPVDWVSDWGANEFRMVDHNTSESLASVNYNTVDFDHEDYFVLMACTDENNNLCFVSYGFDWKGTWAAGKQLKVMSQDIESYTNPYYVYHWVDTNMDGIPQTNEFTLVT